VLVLATYRPFTFLPCKALLLCCSISSYRNKTTITMSATTSLTATTNDKWQATINGSSLSSKVFLTAKASWKTEAQRELLSAGKLGLFHTVTAQWRRCSRNDNGDNVNSFMAVQRERATRAIALLWLSGSLLQQLVGWVGGIVFACKPGKQRWQQRCTTVYCNDCSGRFRRSKPRQFVVAKNNKRQVTIYRRRLQKQRLGCLHSVTAAQRESGGNGIALPWQRVTATCWGELLDSWHSGIVAAALVEEKVTHRHLVAKKTANNKQQSTGSSRSTEVV